MKRLSTNEENNIVSYITWIILKNNNNLDTQEFYTTVEEMFSEMMEWIYDEF